MNFYSTVFLLNFLVSLNNIDLKDSEFDTSGLDHITFAQLVKTAKSRLLDLIPLVG